EAERRVQQAGHDEEACGQHRMQREDAEVEPQELAVAQHRADQCRHGLRVATNSGMAMPAMASATISQKMPRTPTTAATSGPATSAIMNDAPMVMPTVASALVRFSSVVRSATSARITEPTAPAPWSARPTMTPPIEVDMAATALPSANRTRPATIITLRPTRSDKRPKGIWRRPWVRP